MTGPSSNFKNIVGGSANDQITGNPANNIVNGGAGDDAISGGGGNEILVGDTGNDRLKGIRGRNISVCGTGGDLLRGGRGDDVRVGDSTVYDANPAAWNLLLSERTWSNSHTDRTHDLLFQPGGANLCHYLNSSTVANDHSADDMTGGDGPDVFMSYSSANVVTDLLPG